MTVQPQGERLAPGELVERVRRQRPGEEVVSLQLSADPAAAAVAGFAPKDGAPRGERRHLDPHTGELLAQPRQNGKASCRASVCQYVSISWVAGSLKNKQNNRPYTL